MGRFSNLEFNDPKKPGATPPPGVADPLDANRDEAFYLAQAGEHFRAARFEKALRLYSRALEYDPNLHAGWLGQLRMLVELDELNEACLWADKGLDIHRDNPELLAAKAVATARQGEPGKALAFTDLALKKPAGSPFVWLARGEVLAATDQTAAADACFQKSIAESKGDWFSHLLVARALHFWRADERASAWARKAIERDATRAFAWATLGDIELRLGLGDAARGSYRKALNLDRDCEPARAGMLRAANVGFLAKVLARLRALFSRR